MKKIYFEPKMRIKIFDMEVFMQNPSINSDLENHPGQGGDDDDYGNAKERDGWEDGGLW